MVSPFARDLYKAFGQAFVSQAVGLNRGDGAIVVWLDVRLNAVEPHAPKAVIERQTDGVSHVAMAREVAAKPISKVAHLACATDDSADGHVADESAVFDAHDHEFLAAARLGVRKLAIKDKRAKWSNAGCCRGVPLLVVFATGNPQSHVHVAISRLDVPNTNPRTCFQQGGKRNP